MPDQSGTKPPFSNNGEPVDVSESGTPTDLLKSGGKSDAAKGGDQRNVIASRPQPTEPPGQPPTPPWLANREQQAGSPAQRVAPQSIPQGGLVPPTTTQQPKGTGSIGNGAKPFKGMR